MSSVWRPIEDHDEVLGDDTATHAPIAQRVEENARWLVRNKSFLTGAKTWPSGESETGDPTVSEGFLVPGDNGAEVREETRGVQLSTHPEQWLCIHEASARHTWAEANPDAYLWRVHICCEVEQAPVHVAITPDRGAPDTGEPGDPGPAVESPGYAELEVGAERVVTIDVPFSARGRVSQRFGRELGVHVWVLSGLGDTDDLPAELDRVSDDRRVLELDGAPIPDEFLGKLHQAVFIDQVGTTEAAAPGPSNQIGDRPGIQKWYQLIAIARPGLLIWPRLDQYIAERLTDFDYDNLEATDLGKLILHSIHAEIVPREWVDNAEAE